MLCVPFLTILTLEDTITSKSVIVIRTNLSRENHERDRNQDHDRGSVRGLCHARPCQPCQGQRKDACVLPAGSAPVGGVGGWGHHLPGRDRPPDLHARPASYGAAWAPGFRRPP